MDGRLIEKAAIAFAARGWPVFPVPPGKKKSYKSAGRSDGRKWGMTTDAAEIESDWQRWPAANVGIATGAASGVLVIEADTQAGHGVDGIANLAALIDQHGGLPETIEAISPSGSWHIYFRFPAGEIIANSTGQIAPGVDVRGEGGMVIAPPSVKPGAEKPYRWKNPPEQFELAECPEWLLTLARKPVKARKSDQKPPIAPPWKLTTGWAETALKDEIYFVMSAENGTRNDALNRAAFNLGQIVAGGHMDRSRVAADLTEAAAAIGLEPAETLATIESAFAAAASLPRGPTVAATSDGKPRPNEADDDQIDLSHDALANEMGRRGFNRNARFVPSRGSWVLWNKTRWVIDERLEHLTLTREFVRQRAREILAWAERKAAVAENDRAAAKITEWAQTEARALRSKTTVSAVEALARSNAGTTASADLFDADRMLLGTPDGTVDLRTGQIRQPVREDYITKLTSVAPRPGTPVLWLRFLHEIFDGDVELVQFMQRAAGYALTGETREHKLLFLYGTGRNGKSVFLNTLFDIWGDYSRKAAAATFLKSTGEKHPTDVAGLQGARLVAGSELPKGKTWDESVIKDLTGGDVMTARFMRQDFFDFVPQLTLMIAGNNQPSFRGVDEAIRARVVLVPFTVTIPPEKRDKHLPDKLKAEAGQILQWAIDGALQWQERGLDVPASVAAASAQYFDDEDVIGQFIADEIERCIGAFTSSIDLHNRFTRWCNDQGLLPWTQSTLIKELRSRGFNDHRTGKHGRGLTGLRLKG